MQMLQEMGASKTEIPCRYLTKLLQLALNYSYVLVGGRLKGSNDYLTSAVRFLHKQLFHANYSPFIHGFLFTQVSRSRLLLSTEEN